MLNRTLLILEFAGKKFAEGATFYPEKTVKNDDIFSTDYLQQ